MKSDDEALQVEVTIATSNGRKGGHRRSPAVHKASDPPRIPRLTRLMALAIKFQAMIDRREIRDYADLARLGHVTRARLTQIMNLLLLAPKIQEEILQIPTASREFRESQLRPVVRHADWEDQLAALSRANRPAK